MLSRVTSILRENCQLSATHLVNIFADTSLLCQLMNQHKDSFEDYLDRDSQINEKKIKETLGFFIGRMCILNRSAYDSQKSQYVFENYVEFVIWMHHMTQEIHKNQTSLLIVAENMFYESSSMLILQYINHYLSKNNHIKWVFHLKNMKDTVPPYHYFGGVLKPLK